MRNAVGGRAAGYKFKFASNSCGQSRVRLNHFIKPQTLPQEVLFTRCAPHCVRLYGVIL